MLTFNGVTSERADEILSSLDKNVLEKLAEVLGNIGASTFFIEEVFNKHNYLNTVAYFVIPMVGVGTGKVVLVYVDEADVVGLNTTFEDVLFNMEPNVYFEGYDDETIEKKIKESYLEILAE